MTARLRGKASGQGERKGFLACPEEASPKRRAASRSNAALMGASRMPTIYSAGITASSVLATASALVV
ncbi:MAG: hypothetical protein LBD68_04150, partial [Zoogloeaceae bacterium]|nr:hypothetical protein [Zoogloeaceae bacterium]